MIATRTHRLDATACERLQTANRLLPTCIRIYSVLGLFCLLTGHIESKE